MLDRRRSPRARYGTWFLAEDAEQKYLLVADGANNEVHILVRATGERIGAFGRSGRNAGDFHWVHNIAVDAKGSVYRSEVDTAKRAQKFKPASAPAK